MRTLLIFAGAGASRGVSSTKYPMALDFRKRLPKSITSSHLYLQLVEHLRQSRLADGVDIEHVLWELGRLSELLGEWVDPQRFAAYLLTSNQIGSIAQSNNSGPGVHGQFSHLRTVVHHLQDQINERVYEFYSQAPEKNELKSSWLPLLEHLSSASFDQVDIVTTNYDLVIEHALELLPSVDVNMGFSQGLYPGINLPAWRSTDSQGGLLTKLHGSVDWKIGNGGSEAEPVIRRGHPEFDGDHRKRLILYPGFKGIPSREPFVAFHEYFRRRLQFASHVLFIGFAFRDDFINGLISSELPHTAKVAVINPSQELPKMSFLEEAHHLKQGFGIPTNSTILGSEGLQPFNVADLDKWLV